MILCRTARAGRPGRAADRLPLGEDAAAVPEEGPRHEPEAGTEKRAQHELAAEAPGPAIVHFDTDDVHPGWLQWPPEALGAHALGQGAPPAPRRPPRRCELRSPGRLRPLAKHQAGVGATAAKELTAPDAGPGPSAR